jgi:hypothetical protein
MVEIETRRGELDWFPLDPAKAEMGAVEGAYVGGATLLLLPQYEPDWYRVVVTGLMSCGGKTAEEAKASAVYHASRYRDSIHRGDFDQKIPKKTLLSWKKED